MTISLDKIENRTITDKIIEFFLKCPLIDDKSPISADYIGDEIGTYSVDGSPSETILKSYIDYGNPIHFLLLHTPLLYLAILLSEF